MPKTENRLKIFIVFIFFAVLFSQLIFYGTNAIIAEFEKNNPVVTPLALTGTGTYLQPYLITSDNDLNNLCAYTNSGGNTTNTYFKLTAKNLDENGALVVSLKTPIGTSTYPFQGIFDGNNLTITGATLATNAQNQTGIFGAVKNATIKNLTVAYKTQDTTSSTLGGIVATAYSSNIINCTNKTEIHNTATDSMVAGIVGYAYNNQIIDCINEKTISSLTDGDVSYTGGIVAYSYNTTIMGCAIKSADVTISGSGAKVNICGAISSLVTGGTTSQCFNMSSVVVNDESSLYSYAGGIIGQSTNHTITNCFNRGYIFSLAKESISNKITPTSYAYYYQKDTHAYAGGICGSGSSTTISNCYNTSSVSGGTQIYDISISHSLTEKLTIYYYTASVGDQIVTDTLKGTITIINKYYYHPISPNSYGDTNTYTTSNTISKYDANFTLTTECYEKNPTNKTTSNGYTYFAGWEEKTTTGSFSLNLLSTNYFSQETDGNTTGIVTKKILSQPVGGGYHMYYSKYSNLKVSIDYNQNAVIIKHSYTQNTQANYRPSTKVISDTLINLSLNRSSIKAVNEIHYNTIKSTTFNGTDKSLPNGFSSSIWAYSSIINDGYPHLKKYYWQDQA